MTDFFPSHQVIGAPERAEPIGSKAKFWARDSSGTLWLFKTARAGTGEHWAEKIAAELASLLQLPHATVELATYRDVIGIVTRDFTEDHSLGDLAHGNELLFELDRDYPKAQQYRVHQHTLEAISRVLTQSFVGLPKHPWPDHVSTPWEGFMGYLLLDAVIGNTDRHHQNWGLLVMRNQSGRSGSLAPTFDHASSRGRELSDEQRERMLTTRDTRGDLKAYAGRAKSALYRPEPSEKLSPVEAFLEATFNARHARRAWLDRLETLAPEAVSAVIDRMPGQIMSAPARRFALALIEENRTRLLAHHV